MNTTTPAALLAALALATTTTAAAPQYTIIDMGLAFPGDAASQGMGVSPGGVAVGRSLGAQGTAFTWTTGAGISPLPNFTGKPFGVANGANDSGLVAGTGATTFFGSGAVPLLWTNGAVAQLPISGALGVGRANDVNASGIVVGSNGGGSAEVAAYWSAGAVNLITATTPGGSSMTTAFRVNDVGSAVGVGTDPANPARNVGLMYDVNGNTMAEIPSLAGDNGTIAFDISQAGHVVGSSMLNQGAGMPFIWSQATGSLEIPLPVGTSQGSARGVNSNGWAVGTASSAFAIPFLYDGEDTYRLQDLIDAATGWDLSMNTSSSALGIAEDGSIVGTGIFNGETRAFYMSIVPAPGAAALFGLAGFGAARRRR